MTHESCCYAMLCCATLSDAGTTSSSSLARYWVARLSTRSRIGGADEGAMEQSYGTNSAGRDTERASGPRHARTPKKCKSTQGAWARVWVGARGTIVRPSPCSRGPAGPSRPDPSGRALHATSIRFTTGSGSRQVNRSHFAAGPGGAGRCGSGAGQEAPV